MKIDLNNLMSQEGWRSLSGQARRLAAQLARTLLVVHTRTVEAAVVVIVVAVTIYLVVVLFYLPPSGVEVKEPEPLQLDTQAIDRLVGWIDKREETRDEGFALPPGTLFP
jgi:hypothetical protein